MIDPQGGPWPPPPPPLSDIAVGIVPEPNSDAVSVLVSRDYFHLRALAVADRPDLDAPLDGLCRSLAGVVDELFRMTRATGEKRAPR